jgi:PAS domain S-box-containing protein
MSRPRTQHHDQEALIPYKALQPQIDYVRLHQLPTRVFTDRIVGAPIDAYGPRDKFTWQDAATFLENLEEVCTYDELYLGIYDTVAEVTNYKVLQGLAGLFASPSALYKGLVKWFGPAMWPNTTASIEVVDPTNFVVRLGLKPGFSGCKSYFDMCAVMFSNAPRFLGYSHALIDATTSGERGTYRIRVSKSRTLTSRARRMISGDVVLSELTEQHNELLLTNEELQNQRAAYARAVHGASDGLWEIALGTGAFVASERWCALVGLDREAASVDAWLAHTHPDDRDALRAAIDSRDVRLELRVTRGEGWRWVEARAERVDDAEGSFLAGSIRDITDRKQAAQDMRAIVEISPNPMCIMREGDLLYANQAAYALLGKKADIEDAARSPHVRNVIAAQLERAERAERDELEWPLPDYDSIPASIRVTSCQFQSEPALMLSIRDLSAEREITARMIQMDRLVSIGTLAAGIGHEINNPLTYVYGNIDLLRSELSSAFELLSDDDPRNLRETLDESISVLAEMSQGAERIRDIVQDLRIFSRLREENRLERFDAAEVVDSSINISFSEIRHRARLVKDYRDAPRVHFDRARLAQILTNLLINAAHAIPTDAPSDGHTIRVSVRASPDGGDTLVAVSDTGCGIPREHLDRIFDPFFTTKPEGTGTGLGLSICQSLARSLGGDIWVDSAEGAGTTVTVRLPSAEAGEEVGLAEPSSEVFEDRITVVVVDDEHAICDMIARGLSESHNVLTFLSHEDALDAVRNGMTFDIILVDVMGPRLTGVDFLELVEHHVPDVRERASLITGGVFSAEDAERMRRANVPILHKPFSPRAVRRHVQQRHQALEG